VRDAREHGRCGTRAEASSPERAVARGVAQARGRRGTSAGMSGTRAVCAGAVRQERWPSRTTTCRRACAAVGLAAHSGMVCTSLGAELMVLERAGTRMRWCCSMVAWRGQLRRDLRCGKAGAKRGSSNRRRRSNCAKRRCTGRRRAAHSGVPAGRAQAATRLVCSEVAHGAGGAAVWRGEAKAEVRAVLNRCIRECERKCFASGRLGSIPRAYVRARHQTTREQVKGQ
jgi:hypothetical protein